jgi:pimeloyl-ACP methyl ester carboxylesterase
MSTNATSASAFQATSAAATETEPRIEKVTSRDGTTIGYRRFGRGPAIVLLHGSASSGAHHTDLARLLADEFTVIVPDRRGRGLSGAQQPGAGTEIAQELDDLVALTQMTGARDLFGLSSGACILLNAALSMPAIRRVVLYEPPLFRDRATPAGVLREYDAEMIRGETGRAMVTAMRGAQMGPGWFRALPKALTSRLVEAGMKREAKAPTGPYPTMRELAPTLHADFAIVTDSSGRLGDWRSITANVLLIGGSTSAPFLKRPLADLEGAIPGVERVELAGVGHEASWNQDRRGKPEVVAAELRRFFAG